MPSVEVTASAVEAEKRDEADGEIEPQHDFACDLPQVEHLVGDKKQDMARGIDERADADHPAHVHQLIEARNPPQRRDRQRHQQEDQRPIAGAVDDVVERAGADRHRVEVEVVGRDGERHEQQNQRGDAQDRQPARGIAPDLPGGLRPNLGWFGRRPLNRRIGHVMRVAWRPSPRQ